MCGICGVVTTEFPPDRRREAVERMCAAMVHRGPDDAGLREFGGACIGMRRLSIIDCSSQGHQPMPNEDRSVWVVLNGEIYNFQALRRDLAGRGHAFRSATDTEVIVHLFEERGTACSGALRGMFGFAVWDERERRLLLVRDRLGIKPLYYAEIPGGWAFASELGALLAGGLVAAELDPLSLRRYLSFGYCVPPETMVRGVRVLPPGHMARMGGGGLSVERWWDFPEQGTADCGEEEIVPRLRALLEESIRLHRISDVPVGAFLSGGIDSTAVVGLMSRLLDEPVRTFSIGFDDVPGGFDEREYSRLVARAFKTRHAEVVVKGETVREELPRIIGHMDQPSFDGVNTYLISRAAKEGGVTVALSGLGGDEVFGGYDSFRMIPSWGQAARWWGRLPAPFRSAAVAALRRVRSGAGASERDRKVNRLRWVDSPERLYALARFTLWPEELDSLYADGFDGDLSGDADVFSRLRRLAPEGAGLWRMVSLLEVQTYMGWRLLRDTDAMSMAHSLEVRVPIIDHEVVEFVFGLPEGWERRWGHPKRLLTEALSDVLPGEIVRREKQGFAFPMEKWMKEDLQEIVEDALLGETARGRGFFSARRVENLYAGFLRGDYGYPVIWELVVLELWIRWMSGHRRAVA